ncbi:hypothetical protein [Bdellovibrio bacteriovorus]|uniref:hypothetical protein n=1 Tax=Bdellovibrio bacteriovorus TaxID=959 RepID=UPI0035A5B49A
MTDVKVRQTPVLREKLLADVEGLDGMKYYLEHLQSLISHNTLEAAIHQLNQKKLTACLRPKAAAVALIIKSARRLTMSGKTTPDVLAKEIDVSYSTFGGPMKAALESQICRVIQKADQSHG